MNDITIRPASRDDLDRIWDNDFEQHPHWPREWKERFVRENEAGMCKTFGIFDGEAAIGTCTLIFSPASEQVGGRVELANGTTIANVCALRINKEYEGQGHVSRLMILMEQYARERGCTTLTVGVEPKETRPLAIYLHWGYTDFVRADVEDDDGELILYYAKQL